MKQLKELLRRRYQGRALAFFFTYVMFLNISLPVAWAGPEGAQVINGEVSIQQSAYNTTITASDKAIINYSSFDIARPETVQFIQPGSSASVLNRILSASPTNIDGTLLANGRVFFVNPAGIYIGAGARINVNQLVASGLNISNSDFINGRYNFAGGNGSVINSGDISAEQVYLIGKQVTNSGNISCPAGYVVMAAGDRIFLGEPGSEIVLEIDESSPSESADAVGSGAGVLNEGTVDAAGGIIALAAAGDIYSQAISNVGSLSTSVEASDAGKVKLIATEGTVVSSGSIEATSSSGTGGTVQMLGDRVGLFDAAEIDVSGSDGGGTVLVGGDYQGKGEVPTASQTFIGPDSSIKADATENGDGGRIIVWADDITRFYGDISARGGAEAGDGGFVEVSGKENLGFYGYVDTQAPMGNNGTLLLDPTDLTITDTATGENLDPDFTGTINFGDGLNDGTDSVSAGVLEAIAAGTDIILQATNKITIDPLTSGGKGGVDKELTLNQTGDVKFLTGAGGFSMATDNKINITGTANLTIDAIAASSGGTGDGPVSLGELQTTSGNITVRGTTVTLNENFTAGGAIAVTGTNINLNGTTYTSTGNDVTFDGEVDLDAGVTTTVVTAGGVAGDAVTFTSPVNDAASDTTLQLVGGAGEVDMQGNVGTVEAFTVSSAGQVDLADVTADEAISVTGTNIDLNGTTYTSTGNDVTFDGEVDLDAGVTTTVVTAGGVAGDAVTFTSPVNDAASDTTLQLVGGAGEVDMQGNVGTMEAFTVSSTGQVDLADVTANEAISVTGTNIDLNGTTYTSTGNDVTFDGAVDLDALATTTVLTAGGVVGDVVTFTRTIADAASDTTLQLVAGAGEVDMQGDVGTTNAVEAFIVSSAGQVDLANVTTDGNLELHGTTTVADGSTLTAGNNLDVGANVTGNGALTLIATGGSISGSGTIQATDGAGTDLTLRQGISLDLANLTFGNQSNTDLMVESYTRGITIDETKPANAADQWKSIAATAVNNIELSSDDNIRIASAGLSSSAGGVKIISDDGTISTPGGGIGVLDAPITGFSDTSGAGVDLPNGTGKAAIVIRSPSQDLTLGSNAALTANGTYSLAVDDRSGVWFDASGPDAGDPIDVAIYLGTYEPGSGPTNAPVEPYHDVAIDSKISIADYGTMVIDADEIVTFGDAFGSGSPPPDQTTRLEVVSRISQTLEEVIGPPLRLPYARNPALIGTRFLGTYVLRGDTLLAEILVLIEAVPWAVPRPLELEMGSEVEGPDTEALDKLLNELGIGVQPYVTEAYAASLSTDLRLFSAAEKLQQLIPILEDADGNRIAGLREATAQFFPSLDALSEEQVSSFAQELVRHKGDGTDYDVAGQCIFALTEYVTILGNDIGWPADKSIGFVMSRYVPRLTEGDEIRLAVIQLQLQKAFGF
ncbi:beta strand repeat-containing protein [Planctomycetota bacterium]